MKKNLFVLLMTILPILLKAQNHMQFKGVEMNGTHISFADSLKTKGFVIDSQGENTIWMSGSFVNEDVIIGILATPKTNTICRLMVCFEEKDNWDSLKSQYNKLKESYEIKYEKDVDYSFFRDPYYEGDGYEMTAVKSNKCRFSSFFKGDGGGIIVEISNLARVVVYYEDFVNTQLENKEKQEIALDDI